jgi:hypothetical protein
LDGIQNQEAHPLNNKAWRGTPPKTLKERILSNITQGRRCKNKRRRKDASNVLIDINK